MLLKDKTEYEIIREETTKIQDCITEYIKMFFAASAAILGVIIFFMRSDFAKGYPIAADVVGYGMLFLSMIVVSFSSIIFHKFNTHNRYTGYARALSYEEQSKKVSKIFLWENCLSIIYRDDLAEIKIDPSWPEQKQKIIASLRLLRGYGAPGFSSYLRHAVDYILVGFWMVIRAPIKRFPTRSWTYPYPISLGLFVVGFFLLGAWLKIADKINGADRYFQFCILIFIILAWCGMSYRLYRLCGQYGDRTIESYTLQFILAREEALARVKPDISYPWGSLDNLPLVTIPKRRPLMARILEWLRRPSI